MQVSEEIIYSMQVSEEIITRKEGVERKVENATRTLCLRTSYDLF